MNRGDGSGCRNALGSVRKAPKQVAVVSLLGAAAAGYMLFESQWLRHREDSLAIPGLVPALNGLTVLHLSDVHAGQPGLNMRALEKAVRWAEHKEPDLIVLTGDILGGHSFRPRALRLLGRLQARLGVYAVPGNHEYGLSKNPLTRAPRPIPWEECGVVLLRDSCVSLPIPSTHSEGAPEPAARVSLCGADYLTGGAPLLRRPAPEAGLNILLVHRPPLPDDPLSGRFDLTFAGHTHGGQIRVPTPWGLRSPHEEGLPYLQGVHRWGRGLLAISAGIGTTFLPFRLFTRPEVTLYRLVAEEGDRSRGRDFRQS